MYPCTSSTSKVAAWCIRFAQREKPHHRVMHKAVLLLGDVMWLADLPVPPSRRSHCLVRLCCELLVHAPLLPPVLLAVGIARSQSQVRAPHVPHQLDSASPSSVSYLNTEAGSKRSEDLTSIQRCCSGGPQRATPRPVNVRRSSAHLSRMFDMHASCRMAEWNTYLIGQGASD